MMTVREFCSFLSYHRACSWVARKQTAKRCKEDGVADACRDTCDNCPSTSPTGKHDSMKDDNLITSLWTIFYLIIRISDSHPAPSPLAPSPSSPTDGELNGEEACEGYGYGQAECLAVGNGSCCEWDDRVNDVNECWSDIGQNTCPGKSPYGFYKTVFFFYM